MADRSLFRELRDRKVVQVAAIYGAVAWGVTEVIVTIVEQLFLPQWVSTLAVIFFVVGFPVAMFLSWTFDLTAEGIRRTEIRSGRGTASIALSMGLLVAGTAGLFFLIRPAMEQRSAEEDLSAPPNSVAVLEFDNATANPDDDHRSSGLSDALRDQLGRVSELRIAARSSSIAIISGGLDARGMADRLGVAHLVEGSLRRQGNLLVVSVQLIDGRSGLAKWNETFRRGTNELLNVQQEIAEAVVRNVLPSFAGEIAAPATMDLSAYDLMLLARHYEQQVRDRQIRDDEKLRRAIDLYRRAVQADPRSALAHSRLASALLYIGDISAAEDIIGEALYLNPYLSEVHNTVGELFWARGDSRAGQAFEEAVKLNPDNVDALHNLAHYFWYTINVENVADLYRRALELDRESIARYAALGEFFAVQSRPDEALDVAREVEERFEGVDAYRIVGRIMELTGKLDEAIAWVIRARDAEPDNPDHVWQLAALFAEIGDFGTASTLEPDPAEGLLLLMRRYPELVDSAEEKVIDNPDDIAVRYSLGFAYNATGQYELAVRILRSAGLPGSAMTGMIRQAPDTEFIYVLGAALMETGEKEEALRIVQYNYDYGFPSETDWWSSFHRACALTLLGRIDEARLEIEKIPNSPRLPWDPYLRDSVCMREHKDNLIYQEMLRTIDRRRADLRNRLPETLQRFGVRL